MRPNQSLRPKQLPFKALNLNQATSSQSDIFIIRENGNFINVPPETFTKSCLKGSACTANKKGGPKTAFYIQILVKA